MPKRANKSIFIVGTDTGVGKTIITGLLFEYLLKEGLEVITQKWMQTGKDSDIALHNQIANFLSEENKRARCPYHFKLPASPHLSAQQEKKVIDPRIVKQAYSILYKKFGFVLVEGIGGALVPFNQQKLVIDIAKDLKMPVLIVAQNKLGVINHLLLTIEALKKRKMKIVGVVFNGSPEKQEKLVLQDNPRIVHALTGIEIFGSLPWLRKADLLCEYFRPIGSRLKETLF